jgi:hypothetical protein
LEVDHQRRFNELQARFRVNYAKKPQKTSGSLKSNDLLGSSMPGSTFNEHGSYPSMSSSYTDGVPSTHRRKLSLDQSANSKLLGVRKEGSKIKASTGGGGGNISKASGTAAIPIKSEAGGNSGSGTTQQSSSLPSRTMPIAIQRVHRGGPFQPFDSEQRQKRLDDQLVKVDFDDITVSELKEMLRQRGKPATGKKAILLQRLQEEREIIKAAKNGGRPISLQQQPLNEESGSSPMMMAASMPNNSSSMLLSSSPGTSLLSLNRSIQDMHIGSPPSQPSRRFSPYATSPRSNPVPLSPQSSFSSSSVPTGGTLDANIRLMRRPQPQQGWSNSRQKLYAPFTSSALATPDREDDYNPFDDLDGRMQNEFESPNQAPMEWTDPSLELLLQQGMMFVCVTQ